MRLFVRREDGVGCGAECLNRLVLSECDPMHCPCRRPPRRGCRAREYKSPRRAKRTGKRGTDCSRNRMSGRVSS